MTGRKYLQAFQSTALSPNLEPISKWNFLQNFYKRFNKVNSLKGKCVVFNKDVKKKVTLDKMALESEREELRRENEDLKTILKRYLDGISVNDEVMSRANPLLIVNGRTSEAIRVTSGDSSYNQPNTTTTIMIQQYTH